MYKYTRQRCANTIISVHALYLNTIGFCYASKNTCACRETPTFMQMQYEVMMKIKSSHLMPCLTSSRHNRSVHMTVI